jgi:hypothetical protein
MSGAQPMSEANALAEESAVGTQRHAFEIVDSGKQRPDACQD